MQPTGELDACLGSFLSGPLREPIPSNVHQTHCRTLILILATVALGLSTRLYHLDAAGFAEDEAAKIEAVRSYRRGDFTVNSEHPMLLKLLCAASLGASEAWNKRSRSLPSLWISEETALRLPSVIFGALTVIPLFLLSESLLGYPAALITSFLWAAGLNAIWFNRIAKEDSVFVFFLLVSYYLYNRAKNLPAQDIRGQERFYVLSGVAVGLMCSSKYLPHFYGLLALFYYLAGYDGRNNRPLSRRMKTMHFAAIILTLGVFDFAIGLPGTWRYLWNFVRGNLQVHHGYVVMNRLYPNDMGATPAGPPWYLYYLYLLVKMPVPVLAAFVVGLIEIFTWRRRERTWRGYLFLRVMLIFWLIPMPLLGAKFLRYTLTLMPFVYMTAAVGTIVIWRLLLNAASRGWDRRRSLLSAAISDAREPNSFGNGRISKWWPNGGYGFANLSSVAVVMAVFVIWPAIAGIRSLPYPSLYTNLLGGGRADYFFPHDEFYDVGARESIRYIAEHAAAGARVATDIPGVLKIYLERYGRPDIRSEIISRPRSDLLSSPPDYVLFQPGRIYYENQDYLRMLRNNLVPVQVSCFRNSVAAEVFDLRGLEQE